MTAVALDERDRAMLDNQAGAGAAWAMAVLTRVAEAADAPRLIDVTSAHIDGCLYHGQASLDFAERLVSLGARVRVPTTLNVALFDQLHPELYRGDEETAARARRLAECYIAMGCEPTWTCAPYQLRRRPLFGEHIAWAESNAIVFANSVLGARTDRYGDFIDIFAAITGRVPDSGLHRTENRRGQVLFRLTDVPAHLLDEDAFYPVLGHLVGAQTGADVPVIDGLPPVTHEDRLKALGAAAASSGAVALFHAVGVTPEAATLEDALHGREPERAHEVSLADVRAARDALTTAASGRLGAVCLGTPHFSLAEFARLVPLLDRRVHANVTFYVSTSRQTAAEVEANGWLDVLQQAGVELVLDTCTYLAPVLRMNAGIVMTNSAKWAYYAPGNLGVGVVFGTLRDCVRSALQGKVVRDERIWG